MSYWSASVKTKWTNSSALLFRGAAELCLHIFNQSLDELPIDETSQTAPLICRCIRELWATRDAILICAAHKELTKGKGAGELRSEPTLLHDSVHLADAVDLPSYEPWKTETNGNFLWAEPHFCMMQIFRRNRFRLSRYLAKEWDILCGELRGSLDFEQLSLQARNLMTFQLCFLE